MSGYAESEDGYIDRRLQTNPMSPISRLFLILLLLKGKRHAGSDGENGAVQFRSEFMTGALDIIIIDKENLEVYVDQAPFLRLDDFLEAHKGEKEFENLNVFCYENAGDERKPESGVYAVEISNMAFFDNMNLVKKYPKERQTMYLAIGRVSRI